MTFNFVIYSYSLKVYTLNYYFDLIFLLDVDLVFEHQHQQAKKRRTDKVDDTHAHRPRSRFSICSLVEDEHG